MSRQIAVVADGPLLRPVDFGQEYCLTEWGLSYNRIVDLGQNGCSTSHTGWDTLSLTPRHKRINTASLIAAVDTIVEETDDQINDEVAVDAALEDLSVTTASDSEMSVAIRWSLRRLGKHTMQSLSLLETT